MWVYVETLDRVIQSMFFVHTKRYIKISKPFDNITITNINHMQQRTRNKLSFAPLNSSHILKTMGIYNKFWWNASQWATIQCHYIAFAYCIRSAIARCHCCAENNDDGVDDDDIEEINQNALLIIMNGWREVRGGEAVNNAYAKWCIFERTVRF